MLYKNPILFYSLFILLLFVKPTFPEVRNISSDDLKSRLYDDINVVDIRTEVEWEETGTIPGSYLLTFFDEAGNYDKISWFQSFEKIIPESNSVIIVCRSGRRSAFLARLLTKELDEKLVYNLNGGILDWLDNSFETETFQKN